MAKTFMCVLCRGCSYHGSRYLSRQRTRKWDQKTGGRGRRPAHHFPAPPPPPLFDSSVLPSGAFELRVRYPPVIQGLVSILLLPRLK